MLARGGKLVVAAARRQLQVHLGPVASYSHFGISPLPSARREDARRVSTGVLSVPVDEQRRRHLNRILYRSRQRGYLELDLLLGKWVTEHIDELNETELDALVELLEEENPDLLSWLTGQVDAPEKIAKNSIFLAINKQVSNKLTEYSSVETRAPPGQPWVRGWDDNRQAGGPQVGNQ